jgi:capsular exopolysaccharide synthesis family protein
MKEEPIHEEEIHLRDYLWVIYRRRWAIITFITVVLAVVTVKVFTMVPIYRASTQILIEKEQPNILQFRDPYVADLGDSFYNTQYKILESRFLVSKVVERLNLVNDPRFSRQETGKGGDLRSILAGLLGWVTGGDAGEGQHPEEESLKERITGYLLDNLKVEPVRNTRLVKIYFEDEDPVFAARVANALVETYKEHNQRLKLESLRGATEFLNRKIDEQRKKLKESERLLQEYKEKHNILSLKEKENITVAKLAELNTDVLRAENKRVEAETRYRQALKIQKNIGMVEAIPQVVSNPFINKLKSDEANLLREMSELSRRYGKRHPKMITITEKLKTTRKKLNHEIRKVVTLLENEYRVALAKERTMKKALEKLKREAQDLGKRAITYNVLLRDVETNKEMYNILLKRLKETNITSGIQTSFVKVIDRAEPPKRPYKPKKRMIILLSFVVGLFGGVFLAFFLEYLDNTVKTPDDLKRDLQLPYLGPVPHFSSETASDGEKMADLVAYLDVKSTISEAYRGIRTAIAFSSSKEGRNSSLLITSPGLAEGKTITASNIAVTFAQSETRTILVDADMRRPRLHKVFGLSRDTGLSSFLVGASKLEDIISGTDIPNLDLIVAGYIPPNPAELLGSENMKRLLALLKEKYERIIIDSAPVIPVTDSVVLSAEVDQTLLVLNAGKTSRGAALRSVEMLRDVKANIIGAVLNNIKVGKAGHYYYQYYYYYYGEEGAGKKRRGRRGKDREVGADAPV